MEELFKKEGYEVNVAVDGRDSIEKVKANTPDVVLMDMKMPNMNGLEASEEIMKYDRNIPIIMMTAYGEMEIVQKALKVGVKKYIIKPFDIIDLRNLVREVLEQNTVE